MANSWLRLWHDMPNDPKWRTIARKSNQRIGDVISVYLHVLVNVSSVTDTEDNALDSDETTGNAGETQGNANGNATKRGRIKNLCADDIASSLDLDTEQVEQIIAAMQGKVLDGDLVIGWAKRQPKREDSSTARVKAYREKKRAEKGAKRSAQETTCNAGETQGNAPDSDTDSEEEVKDKNTLSDFGSNRTDEVKPASPKKPPAPENPEPEQSVSRDTRIEPEPDTGQVAEHAGESDPPDKTDDRDKPGEPDPVNQAFEEIFWRAGLCKVGKVKACSAFRSKYRDWKKSTHGSPPEFASMLADDIRRRLSVGVFGADKLHPSTYLNQERWNDELPAASASAAGGGGQVRDVSHLSEEQRQELAMYELLEGR
ncbi:hypothetical protein LEA60_18635 [Salmonella enterica]|uniref:hypothetical protein n=1 Tax=Salmonella sp. SAL04162 TaxID=3159782 RepID=UPI002A227E96|nr:hypothetical protein [Salmonella enterica]